MMNNIIMSFNCWEDLDENICYPFCTYFTIEEYRDNKFPFSFWDRSNWLKDFKTFEEAEKYFQEKVNEAIKEHKIKKGKANNVK